MVLLRLPLALTGSIQNGPSHCSSDRAVDCLAFERVRRHAEEHQGKNREDGNNQEADPVRRETVFLFDPFELDGEVGCHEADGKEQDSGFSQ